MHGCTTRPGTAWPRDLRKALVLACVLLPGAAHAEEDLVTDRPDVVESSDVVGPGRLQLETAVAADQWFGHGGGGSVSAPLLLRYGLGWNLELRVETGGPAASAELQSASGARLDAWGAVSSVRVASSRRELPRTAGVPNTVAGPASTLSDRARRGVSLGAAPLEVGFKWHMLDAIHGNPLVPSFCWIAHVEMPTGAGDLAVRHMTPSLRAVGEWDLPWDLALGVMPGVMLNPARGLGAPPAVIFAAVLSKQWTREFRTFGELAVQELFLNLDLDDLITLDGGFAVTLAPGVQLDAAVQVGVLGQHFYTAQTAGISLRI